MNITCFQRNNIGIAELSISFVIIDFAISPITVYRIRRFVVIVGDGDVFGNSYDNGISLFKIVNCKLFYPISERVGIRLFNCN